MRRFVVFLLGVVFCMQLHADETQKQDYKGIQWIYVFEKDTKGKIVVDKATNLIQNAYIEFYTQKNKPPIFALVCDWNTPNPETLTCTYKRL